MEYLSFDLRLGEWNPATSTGVAEVLSSPCGEGEPYQFVLDIDVAQCSQRVDRSPEAARQLGRRLTASVFAHDSLSLWYESYQVARERERGLRLRLHISSWELSRVPWELLYDSRHDDYLVFDPRVSVVRYLRLRSGTPALRQRRTLRILSVVSTPSDLPSLNWEREVAVLREALREQKSAGQVDLQVCQPATRQALHDALLTHTPDVVHYVGHADYDMESHEGSLYLQNETGISVPWEAQRVARMLRRYGVNLVVLNACETATGAWAGIAPALVRADIPAVVAMQWPVEDRAAIRFARVFYRALATGRSIDECVGEGRVGASGPKGDPNDWAAPVLFLRGPSGRLWIDDVAGYRDEKRGSAPTAHSTAPPAMRQLDPGATQGIYFKTRGPLDPEADAGLLCARPELRRAVRLAQQPSVTQYLAVLGARQMGKTTLLFSLRHALQGFYACIFVDLSVLRAQDAIACFRFLAFRVVRQFAPLLAQDQLPEHPHIDSPVDFVEFLSHLAELIPAPRIIVMLDEVGALSPDVSDVFYNTLRTVFTQGRSVDSRLAKYLFVFSGAVDLYALTFGTTSPLNICEKIHLGDLELADLQHLVTQLTGLGVEVADGVAQAIYHLTGGHPYLSMRMCALLERSGAKQVDIETVQSVAGAMLVEDDNIQHVIRELEAHPAARRRLKEMLIEGHEVFFSRNDPVLASLEMIGVIRATQPSGVRNELYARALRQYFAQRNGMSDEESMPAVRVQRSAGPIWERLRALWQRTVDSNGSPWNEGAWEDFAAAFFSVLRAFSVSPGINMAARYAGIDLTVEPVDERDKAWSLYAPLVRVEYLSVNDANVETFLRERVDEANALGLKLVFLLVSDDRQQNVDPLPVGGCDGACAAVISARDVDRFLGQREDLDSILRAKVLDARLSQLPA